MLYSGYPDGVVDSGYRLNIKYSSFQRHTMPPKWAWLLGLVGVAVASPQSNYNLQDLNIEFEEGAGLPEFGTLNGTVTELGELKIIEFICMHSDKASGLDNLGRVFQMNNFIAFKDSLRLTNKLLM